MSNSQELSKTAQNEIAKLKAAYLNNVAAGLLLGGVFLPFVSFFQSPVKGVIVLFSGQSLTVFLGTILALLTSYAVHRHGVEWLHNLKD